MPVSSLTDLSASQKEDLVASLASIVVGSTDGEMSADALSAVAKEAGCDLSGAMASLFASVVEKSGGLEKFTLAPGGGGGGGGGGGSGGGGAAEAEAEEEPEEEEMEAPAVDMFGGDDGGDY